MTRSVAELRLETLTLPTAPVGPDNPLPPLFTGADIHQVADMGDADQEMRENIEYGRVANILPYLTQDGYARNHDQAEADHQTAILENDVLRATFLLGTGGRLWSLVHKRTNRELLFRNPVYQPANLALRNAWLAGGVEWNIGTIGHSPLTCAPLHAARVTRPDGTPVLRMYEYERIRQVVFQIDAYLSDQVEALLVHIRIINPNTTTVPMYWWSNIAVPEAEGVRVVVPADAAWNFGYDRSVRKVPMPEFDGTDRTYTTRSNDAADYFFDLPEGERRWIAALDENGSGLVQASTDRLRGRKLFQWGQGAGGGHWQEWLSAPGMAYLEIQAGLARTQLEHVPMPAGAKWSWLEAYGLLEADPAAVHGTNWRATKDEVSTKLAELIPPDFLDDELDAASQWADSPPEQVLQIGSGWGALERTKREAADDPSLTLPGTPFPDGTLGPPQTPWLELLAIGSMTGNQPTVPPAGYQVDLQWAPLLEAAKGWLPGLHLGMLRLQAGDIAGAKAAWLTSAAEQPTAWAYRNLGALERHRRQRIAALWYYERAHELSPDLLPLTLELIDTLIDTARAERALALVDEARAAGQAGGRLSLAEARAALATGDIDRCGRLLAEGIELPDVREGEGALHELWFAYHAQLQAHSGERSGDGGSGNGSDGDVAVPRKYDFRMTSGGGG